MGATVYRSTAMVLDEPQELVDTPHHDSAGALDRCAGCDVDLTSYGQTIRACQGGARVVVRWFPWPRRCSKPGLHIHQRCGRCGFRWTVNHKG